MFIEKYSYLIPEGFLKKWLRIKYAWLKRNFYSNFSADFRIKEEKDGTWILEFRKGDLYGNRLIFPPADFLNISFISAVPKELPGYFQKPLKNDIIIDAGAFPGDFSVLASRFGKVYAFEPEPENFQYLKEFLYANQAENVEALNLAISDKSGNGYLIPDGVKSSICDNGCNNGLVEVELTSIDDFLSQIGSPYPLIKMDIEGHEIKALRGAERTLNSPSEWRIACYHMVDGKKTYQELLPIFNGNYETELVYPRHLTLYTKRLQ